MRSWSFYLLLTLFFLVVQGLFAMLEMAAVCFNKVRLQYWVSQGNRRARWLHHLTTRPALLFGTALIGITSSLQIGSECSRRFYEALGINPAWAPLSQIILVILLAELTPLLTGMRYAEHIAMLGIPLLYILSILLRPVIWLFDLICRLINRLFKSTEKEGLFLSREELQYMFESHKKESRPNKEINTIVANIFLLKNKTAKELMTPLESVQMIPSFCTVGEMRTLLMRNYVAYLPIYQRQIQQIIGIVYPRDLLRESENKKVRHHARPAWFITTGSSILQILKQFRTNNQSLAIVLDEIGQAVGILTLDEIIDEIFGRSDEWGSFDDIAPRTHHVTVDRVFSGDLSVADFNALFHVHLNAEGSLTLEQLVERSLGHVPEKGEGIQIDQFSLVIEEAPLIGPKKVSVRTVF